MRSPAFLRPASTLTARSASAPFLRSASPFVRLEKTTLLQAILARRGEHQPGAADEDADEGEGADGPVPAPVELSSVRTSSGADTHSTCRPSFVSPRSTEYCCAICIELLIRPVVLSCGHRLCRGCWLRVLQGSQARAVASRTGNAVCPLGRCEVRPFVPEIDRDLESEMRARLGFKQLAAHAAAAELAPALDEESAAAAALNAWAAAGCRLNRRAEALDEETTLRWDEQAAAAAAAAAYAATLEEHTMQQSERTAGCVRIWLRCLFALSAVVLLLLALAGHLSPHLAVVSCK